MKAEIVGVHDVDRIWPLISEKIAACIDDINADCSSGEMWSLCRSGHLMLIIVHDGQDIKGSTVWKFETWANGPVLKNIIGVGEDMASWMGLITDKAHELARMNGAKHFVWQGPRAWSRYFPKARMTCNYIMEVSHDG